MDTSLYKNVFTFLKKAIIQPRRYNWYYLYLVLDRLNNCWGVLQPNSPKHDPCLKDTCIFIEKLNIQHWALSMKKHWPLWFKWPLQTYFWTGHIDSSIKVEMRYSSILFDHTNEMKFAKRTPPPHTHTHHYIYEPPFQNSWICPWDCGYTQTILLFYCWLNQQNQIYLCWGPLI